MLTDDGRELSDGATGEEMKRLIEMVKNIPGCLGDQWLEVRDRPFYGEHTEYTSQW